MTQQKNIELIGAKASLLMGLILGISAMLVFAIVTVIITGESFFLLGWFFTNGYATFSLLLSFIVSLWFAGKKMAININENKPKLFTTINYSVFVNSVIWSVFLAVHFITNHGFDPYFGLMLPLSFAIISIFFTPFTVGHLIYKSVENKITNL